MALTQFRTAKCTEQWNAEEEMATPSLWQMAGTTVPQGFQGTEQWNTEEEVATPRLRPMASTIMQQGSKCTEQWNTEEEMATPPLRPNAGTIVSEGSLGHPYQCGPACKYFAKKRGCKDGTACSHCHLCVYSKNRQGQKFSSRAYRSARHS
jgi:hypothetical protein